MKPTKLNKNNLITSINII